LPAERSLGAAAPPRCPRPYWRSPPPRLPLPCASRNLVLLGIQMAIWPVGTSSWHSSPGWLPPLTSTRGSELPCPPRPAESAGPITTGGNLPVAKPSGRMTRPPGDASPGIDKPCQKTAHFRIRRRRSDPQPPSPAISGVLHTAAREQPTCGSPALCKAIPLNSAARFRNALHPTPRDGSAFRQL
jgi:hypothetical protein